MRKFLHESFQEKSSIYSLKELLESIVAKARRIGREKDSPTLKSVEGVAPSSHFHINQKLDSILSTLELNFFLTKRQECLDQDRMKISIYCLNFGLCQKFGIAFGSSSNIANYFTKRVFDFSPLIQDYIQNNQELVCQECEKVHDLSDLDFIKKYDWVCPSCKKGRCKLINSSKKYEEDIRKIDDEKLLPETEMGILNVLESEKHPLFAAEVAGELDCSYQLVGQRARKLHEKSLITREKHKSRTKYQISELGKNSYFPDGERETLTVD